MSRAAGRAELIEARLGDCGCPEEEYLFDGINLTVHFEPDGTADAFMDGGDWGECETTVEGMTRFAARVLFLALRLVLFADANDLSERLHVVALALGLGEHFLDVGRDRGLVLFQSFDAFDDRPQAALRGGVQDIGFVEVGRAVVIRDRVAGHRANLEPKS